jgi:solute carrier family 45 protein 1/2/4
MEKLHDYQGWTGRFHEWRDGLKERYQNWRQGNTRNFSTVVQDTVHKAQQSYVDRHTAAANEDYSHIYRYFIDFPFLFHLKTRKWKKGYCS